MLCTEGNLASHLKIVVNMFKPSTDSWLYFPGGITVDKSLNLAAKTTTLTTNQAFVLMSTHFKSLANISHFEFVAEDTTAFTIDVSFFSMLRSL